MHIGVQLKLIFLPPVDTDWELCTHRPGLYQAFLFDTFSSFFKFQVSGWGMFFEFQTWVFSKLTWVFWKFGHKKGGKGIFRPILVLFFCGWGMFLPFWDLSFSKKAEFCQNPEFLLGLSFSQNVEKKAWLPLQNYFLPAIGRGSDSWSTPFDPRLVLIVCPLLSVI